MIRRVAAPRHLVWTLLLLTCVGAYAQEGSAPRSAPGFTLDGLDGKPVRLSDYHGKVVLLDFWATWCVPCQTEIPRFVSFQKTYGREGFQAIGISLDDTPEPVRRFYAKFKMNYPVALGTERVADDFGGVLGLPKAFLIARNGRIVKQYDASADLGQMEQDIRKLLSEPTDSN